jgi:molybdate transport system substrate-binding protein
VAACAALAAGGCGSGGSGDGDVIVSAATSLKRAFTAYGDGFGAARARFSFAGSDELAAQIRQGVRPDVFASADTTLPDRLFAAGLVERPRTFARNRLVLATPADGRVRGLDDLVRDGVTVAIGSASVPVGAYTREVLSRLGGGRGAAILAHVRSNEPDVGGIVGKLTQGAVDAGFVYATDVAAAGGRLRRIALPARTRPVAAYAVAVVRGARHPEAARRFVTGLLGGAGARALRTAGFEPPPA